MTVESIPHGEPKRTVDAGRNPRRRHVVFVTYNGLLDPLGPSQILPYLERLHPDWPIHILSFERPDRLGDHEAIESMNRRLRSQAISWTRLRYHKWPSLPATVFDLAAGTLTLRRILSNQDIGLIHARGYLPMSIASYATRKTPLLFDIRGLQPEEYVDGGVWIKGELKWQLAKSAERRFFRRAAGAVVLTRNICPYVEERFVEAGRGVPPLAVIPCCVDLDRFRFDPEDRLRRRTQLGAATATTVFVYSGTIGTWYMPEEMARFVRVFRETTRRAVSLLWMVNNDEERARTASRDAGLGPDEYRILHARADEVPSYLSAGDAALALIKPSFSKRSSSPTKYAECLAMGLPLLICRDVGDGAELTRRQAAVAIDDVLDDATFARKSMELLKLMSEPRAYFRNVAQAMFDINQVALPEYRNLYERLVLH